MFYIKCMLFPPPIQTPTSINLGACQISANAVVTAGDSFFIDDTVNDTVFQVLTGANHQLTTNVCAGHVEGQKNLSALLYIAYKAMFNPLTAKSMGTWICSADAVAQSQHRSGKKLV
jgi:hypothetical protein